MTALMLMDSTVAVKGEASEQNTPVASVRFYPEKRSVGDVMPFYYDGEYHVFYLLNASGNSNIDWEHAVSRDLVHWENLPPAIRHDPKDKTGPEGGCMFTGSIVERNDVFHAFYTSWNPANPAGREFICHATSTDLISWTKHPEDMIAPDGVHYANHQARDFRDPHVVWDEEQQQYVMFVNANKPGKGGFVFGMLTSTDLKTWTQQPAIEGVPGDECPDFFKSGDTYFLHGCNVYASSKGKDGPWRYPTVNRVDRRMAAKRVFDGQRHVWFGGWLRGPMSIPREVYEGPDGLLYMKPVPEVVKAFSQMVTPSIDLSLSSGKPIDRPVPINYLLEAGIDLSRDRAIVFTIRGGNGPSHQFRVSAKEKNVVLTNGKERELRALPVDFTRFIKLQAFVVGSVVELFFNDQFAMTFFVDASGESLRIESDGDVKISSFSIRKVGETKLK